MKNFRLAAAVALGSVSGALIGYSAQAGGDKVAFPENFDKGTLYATVDRYDNKQFRELWATPAAVDAVRKGQPIPSGTVLTLVQYKAQLDAAGSPAKGANGRFQKGDLVAYTVMEKRDGWGSEYKDDIRNGDPPTAGFLLWIEPALASPRPTSRASLPLAGRFGVT